MDNKEEQSDKSSKLRYDKTYNDASAAVVLTSSNGISFRMHDFYLKAASHVFRDMLSLSTNEGAIGLPDSSSAVRIVLDRLTGATGKFYATTKDWIDAYALSKRFEMQGVTAQIKERLLAFSLESGEGEAPRLLAIACQEHPIDRVLAKAALSKFSDTMFMDREIFYSSLSNKKRSEASARPHNLRIKYAESLTTAGYMAYSMALEECEIEGVHYWKCWDWQRVPDAFCRALDKMSC